MNKNNEYPQGGGDGGPQQPYGQQSYGQQPNGQPPYGQQPYGATPQYQQQPPKKKRGCFTVGCLGLILLIVVIAVVAAIAGSSGSKSSDNSSSSASSAGAKGGSPSAPSLSGQAGQAASSARSYLDTQAFSKRGLIDQLSSTAGDNYPLPVATQAVNSLTNVNWNDQAAKAAKSYLQTQSFSCQGLKDQLSSDAGDKFTPAQAAYGAQQTQACK